MSLSILADDLIDASDAATFFAGKSSVPVTVWPHLGGRAPDAPVRVVDSATRACDAAEAAARVAAIVGATPGTTWLKVIDPALRGPIGPEVDTLMRATRTASAVVCAAVPAQGRVVLDRMLLVDGTPLAETSVIDRLRPQLDRPIAWIPIDQMRTGAEALAARLTRLAGTVAVVDAETDADLDALVEAALLADTPPLLVGAAGLARALAARLGLLVEGLALPRCPRWLIVAGSRHPATRRQIAAARRAGLPVLATPDTDAGHDDTALAALAEAARRALAEEGVDVVAVSGARAARALFAALGAERFDVAGAPAPGVSVGMLHAPALAALRLLAKRGDVGPADLYVSLAEATR